MIEHTVSFLKLAALELHRIASRGFAGREIMTKLSDIAWKCEAEAKDLEAALAPKEENK